MRASSKTDRKSRSDNVSKLSDATDLVDTGAAGRVADNSRVFHQLEALGIEDVLKQDG